MTPLRAVFAILFYVQIVCLAAHNVTIDSVIGDEVTGQQVIYTPPTSWEFIQLPKAAIAGSLFNTVLPDGEFPSFTLLFDGTAIYVVCVLVQNAGYTEMGFYLDGVAQGSFIYSGASSSEFIYNVTVYENTELDLPTNLPGGMHNLTVQSYTSMQFDHAIYTVPDSSKSSNGNKVAVIVGPILAVLAALALSLIAALYLRRRRQARRAKGSIEAFGGDVKTAYPMPVLLRDSRKYQNLAEPMSGPEKAPAEDGAAEPVILPANLFVPHPQSRKTAEEKAVRECVVQDEVLRTPSSKEKEAYSFGLDESDTL